MLYTVRIVLQEAKARNLIRENPLPEPEPLGKEIKSRDVFSAIALKAIFPAGKLTEVWYSQAKGCLFMILPFTVIHSGEARALALTPTRYTNLTVSDIRDLVRVYNYFIQEVRTDQCGKSSAAN